MDLIQTYQTSINAIYKRIEDLYSTAKATQIFFYGEDTQKPKLIKFNDPSRKLNRYAYLWTLQAIDQLQLAMDQLVGNFGSEGAGLSDMETGDTVEKLKLWRPEPLVIDENYLKNLKNDFKQCNDVLDQLMKYLTPYLSMGKE